MQPTIDDLLAPFPTSIRATLAPILQSLVQGTDEPTTLSHLSYLDSLPGVTVLARLSSGQTPPLQHHYVILFPHSSHGPFVCHLDREADGLWHLSL